jgi:toxin CptA
MMTVILSWSFAIAALCAGLMGYAIQRGATCTVAAVDEIVTKRKAERLASFVEASCWVAGGLLLAQVLGMLPKMPPGYAVGVATIAGGALLGLGAFVNGACVFGAIARFGSGQWAYAVTPLGFFVGCLSLQQVLSPMAPAPLPYDSPVLQAPSWVAGLFVALAGLRLSRPLRAVWRGEQSLAAQVWSPRAATTVIGITFLIMLLLVGAWAYTDVLAEAARGMAGNLPARALLLLMLLAGAALGGWTAGRFRHTPVARAALLRCFAGGVMMGWGSLLIPGGNDGLILVGMPLLWPYAWLAFASMCVAIGGAQLLQRSLSNTGPVQHTS